jgi:hypothetical protein
MLQPPSRFEEAPALVGEMSEPEQGRDRPVGDQQAEGHSDDPQKETVATWVHGKERIERQFRWGHEDDPEQDDHGGEGRLQESSLHGSPSKTARIELRPERLYLIAGLGCEHAGQGSTRPDTRKWCTPSPFFVRIQCDLPSYGFSLQYVFHPIDSIRGSRMLFAYIGPETMMPVASVIAAVAGVFMMFGHKVVQFGRNIVRRIRPGSEKK